MTANIRVTPQPRTLISQPVYLVDGNCGFCTRSMERVLRQFPGTFVSVPYWEADLESLGLSFDACRERGHFLRPLGDHVIVMAGGASWTGVLLQQRGVWRGLGRLMAATPFRPFVELTYGWVSRNRHRFPAA